MCKQNETYKQYFEASDSVQKVWARSMQLRVSAAVEMLRAPQDWKICLDCGRAEEIYSPLCGNCLCYRFSEDPEIVQFIAVATKFTRPSISETSLPMRVPPALTTENSWEPNE